MASKLPKLHDAIDSSISDGLILYNAPNYVENFEIENNSLSRVLRDIVISSTKKCTYCETSFSNSQEQRAHYKLDWHRYNIKQALIGRAAVSAEEFYNLADDVSSISGSESESSEESEDEEQETEQEIRDQNKFMSFRDAKIFWRNEAGEAFSVYKCLLLGRRELITAGALQELLVKFLSAPKKWLIIMLGGGHFAAAVFEGATITVHKTFHCYTVRAKQGGGQAARDAKGGNHPKSAGASLRRYNEMALVQHVQEIMKAWTDEIAGCSLILHRAVGPQNRGVLFGGKSPPFDKSDPRLRSVPFATRRATLKEVRRIHDVLSTLQCYGSADELEKQLALFEKKNSSPRRTQQLNIFGVESKKPSLKNVDRGEERKNREREIPGQKIGNSSSESGEDDHNLVTNDVEIDFSGLKEYDNTLKKKKRKPSAKQKAKLARKKLSEEVETFQKSLVKACQHGDVAKLQELISAAENWPSRDPKTSEAPSVSGMEEPKTRLKKEDFQEILNCVVSEESGDSLLHVAAAKCHLGIVETLLHAGCDPTLKNRRKFVPYVVSGDKPTKAVFKNFVAQYPDRFDTKLTMIPPPPTEEQEKRQNEKKKEKRKLQKEREKLKKKENFERKIDEDEKVRFLALSDREKRAVAAERRLVNTITAHTSKAVTPVLVRCFQCGKDITGKVPFEYSQHLFCTVSCLQAHRAKTKSYGVEI